MTKPPETHIGPAVAAAPHGDRLLPPARYRHPGGVIRLIIAGLALVGALAVTAAAHATYAGLVQAVFVAAAGAAVFVITLRYRRYRRCSGWPAAPYWRAPG